MNPNQYTDEDIQNYAAGTFSGDKKGFEEHLKNNPGLSNQVEEYKTLYQLLSQQNLTSLSLFNLADCVLEKIEQKEEAKASLQFTLISCFLSLLTIGVIIIIQQYFSFESSFTSLFDKVLFIMTAVMIILFIMGFSMIEARQRQKKFY